MAKNKLNKNWLHDHINDPYVKLAQKEGYRARAAYKLKEIDESEKLIKSGQVIVDLGCTPGQLALAWVLAQGQDVVPIPGTKRVRYLEENVAALDLTLSEHDLAALAAAVPSDAVAGDRYGDLSSIDD